MLSVIPESDFLCGIQNGLKQCKNDMWHELRVSLVFGFFLGQNREPSLHYGLQLVVNKTIRIGETKYHI